MKIREKMSCIVCLLMGMLVGMLIGVFIGFSFRSQDRGRPAIPNVRATVARVESAPKHETRMPASLLVKKVGELGIGESGYVAAFHLVVSRERAWVDPAAICLEQGGNFVPRAKVVRRSDGLHLYDCGEAVGWAKLTSSKEPDPNWLEIAEIH